MHFPTHRRRLLITAAIVTTLIGAALTTAAVGNDYRFEQRPVSITSPQGRLEGVLAAPRREPVRGIVVMVHGDGAVDATQGGLYAPWFEGAADAGWATLSWSKPGVGDSTGAWLEQSMDDRAREVSSVLDWVHTQADVPADRIVLWGASQAGWVLPKVVAGREDVAGVVAVGTAVNWSSQGRFNLEAELRHAGASAAEREAALAASDRTRALLARGATHAQYAAVTDAKDRMTPERWGFVTRNVRSDATHDLRAASTRKIPWLLMVGTHDRNVDVRETARVYRAAFGDDVRVETFDGAHSLARPLMEDSTTIGYATAVLWPRALLAPGVIDTYRHALDVIGASSTARRRPAAGAP